MKINYTCGNCCQPVNVAVDTHRSAEYALEMSVQPCRCWNLCTCQKCGAGYKFNELEVVAGRIVCPECAKDLRQAIAVRRAENMGY
jgi:hypothetical protein